MKRDRFAGQTDDTLQVHHTGAGQPDGHYITPLWFMKKIGQPIHEIYAPVFVSRSHACTFDAYRQKHKAKHHEASHHQYENTHDGTLRSAPDQNRPQPGWTLRFR